MFQSRQAVNVARQNAGAIATSVFVKYSVRNASFLITANVDNLEIPCSFAIFHVFLLLGLNKISRK